MEKINYTKKAFIALALIGVLSACSDKDNVIPDIPPSDGTAMKLNGGEGGSAGAKNTVFVDFSAEQQDAVERTAWSLGFYSGSQFRVILNETTGASALKIDKTDLSAVTAADVDMDALPVELGAPVGNPPVFTNIDNPLGKLDGTLIAEISANDADNKVYVINPIGASHTVPFDPANLYKVRILRKDNGYSLQYAKLADKDFQTLEIKKDEDFNFSYFSFNTGPVTVEPKKNDWDIRYTWSIYIGENDALGKFVYSYSDLIFINHLAGVTAAEVLTSTVSYNDFDESKLSAVTFSSEMDVIGAKWRSTSPATGVQKDRFYVVKDAAGNIYKLNFNSMGVGDDTGERGYPEIEFKLVKRG